MKREAFNHPKMLHLAALLNCNRAQAIGYVTLLIDWVAGYAPQGDVGKWPDGAIARGSDWTGPPEEFIEALVASGWLDRHPDYRLILHDWPDHAERWVKSKLASSGIDFLPCYDTSRDTSPDVRPVAADTSGDTSGDTSSDPPRDQTKPNQTKPNQTKPKADGSAPLPESVDTPEVREAWERWLKHRRARKGPKLTPLAIEEQMAFIADIGPERAVAAIKHSIRNNYQGIFEPGGNARAGPQPTSKQPLDPERMERIKQLASEQ